MPGSVSKSVSETKRGYRTKTMGGGGGLRILLCQSLFSAGKDLWLFCQCKGGHITANVKWQMREGMIGINC